MKANELMIGDWVLVPNRNNYENEKIVAIPINTQIEVGGNCLINPMACKPIPITYEILEKNGFERNERFDYNICAFFSFPDSDFTERTGFGIERRNNIYYITDHSLMPIQYVHELQRALRLCGLTEIANNFKI